jgi:hypothetical protein
MVDVNVVLNQMQGSGTRLNIIILDACRTIRSAAGRCALPEAAWRRSARPTAR